MFSLIFGVQKNENAKCVSTSEVCVMKKGVHMGLSGILAGESSAWAPDEGNKNY
jgi:hypothetical protein